MSIHFFRDVLLFLFVLYYAQGSFYAQGSIVSQIALLLILVISCAFLLKTLLLTYKEPFFKAWFTLLVLNILCFIFTGELSNPYHFSMIKGVIISSLPFFPFYYFARKGFINSDNFFWFFIVMLPITVSQFFFNADQIISQRSIQTSDLVNNISYSFVGLMPFLLLFKKRKVFSIVAMIIILFFIIQGAKRGALIAGLIALLFFIYLQLTIIDKKDRIKGYFFVVLCVLMLGYFSYDLYFSNDFLVSRMQKISEADGLSGRDRIYKDLFLGWYHSNNIVHLIFGFGFAGSLILSGGRYAHNDWLELLVNLGLIGVLTYFCLFCSAFFQMKNQRWRSDKRIVLTTILFIWLFTSIVSMAYTSQNGYTQAIILGFLIGSRSREIN